MTRPFQVQWVQKLFRDLTDQEKSTIKSALGMVPWHEHDDEDISDLWRQVEAGTVAAFTARRDDTGEISLVSFYTVQTLVNGDKNFLSIATSRPLKNRW